MFIFEGKWVQLIEHFKQTGNNIILNSRAVEEQFPRMVVNVLG